MVAFLRTKWNPKIGSLIKGSKFYQNKKRKNQLNSLVVEWIVGLRYQVKRTRRVRNDSVNIEFEYICVKYI